MLYFDETEKKMDKNFLNGDRNGDKYKLFLDNYFVSINLIQNLKKTQINSCRVVTKQENFYHPSPLKNKHGKSLISIIGVK